MEKKRTSRLALTVLVLGILSLIPLFGALFYIPTIIIGIIALILISKNKETLKGKNLAITGISLGSLGLAGCIVIVSLTIPPSLSDAYLIQHLGKNRQSFEELRDLMVDSFTKGGIDQDKHYIDMQEKLKIWRTFPVSDKQGNVLGIKFTMQRVGGGVGGYASSYVWFKNKPISCEQEPVSGCTINSCKPIDEHWYILRESN
jgi:hypothetical protein